MECKSCPDLFTGSAGGLFGFGIVTPVSLLPVIGVLPLNFYIAGTVLLTEIVARAPQAAGSTAGEPAWYERSLGVGVILGLCAIPPLVPFLFLEVRQT